MSLASPSKAGGDQIPPILGKTPSAQANSVSEFRPRGGSCTVHTFYNMLPQCTSPVHARALWLCSRRLSPSFTGDRHVQKTHVTRSRDSVAGAGMDLRPPLDRGLLAIRHMATGLAGWNGPCGFTTFCTE
ncbi:unnamed protein product [Penicillium roqueforti FM164]|uniref:Genomic scaffold, ProqFM164S01 n=1 Tax=Penicillium roqueforti (strain FM164) TaxID=1365484 RepID=W6Q0R5_PENRF|nr:unnamed protein product [Penicillium roqueforti FM164]